MQGGQAGGPLPSACCAAACMLHRSSARLLRWAIDPPLRNSRASIFSVAMIKLYPPMSDPMLLP
jgi:hypothetical protein